jgi:hypothetical protein
VRQILRTIMSRCANRRADLATLFSLMWFPLGLLLLLVLAAVHVIAAMRPAYFPVSSTDSLALGIQLELSAKMLVHLPRFDNNGVGTQGDRTHARTVSTSAGLLFLVVLAAIRLVTVLSPGCLPVPGRIVDALIFVLLSGAWAAAAVIHYCRREYMSFLELLCAPFEFLLPAEPSSRRGCRTAATLCLMGMALVAGVRYETYRPQIPDVYQLTVHIGGATLEVPWSVLLRSTTSEPLSPDVTAAFYKERLYNIPGGDLRTVLHHTLHSIDIPLFTNDQFEALGGAEDPRLAKALRMDMSGFKADAVVGRLSASGALAQALRGTGCQQELLNNAAVYIFCHLHMKFAVTVQGKPEED